MILRINAYFLLLILFGYLLKPIIPYVEYALNQKYIEKNLCINRNKPKNCCHGKCYLKKQLAKQSDESRTDKNSENKKLTSTFEISVFLKRNSNLIYIPVIKHLFLMEPIDLYSQIPAVCIFVPPKHFA